MCGIVGMASLSGSKNWTDKETWFSKAIYVDTLRGVHSTGIFCVPYNASEEDIILHKKAMPGYDFLELSSTTEILYEVDKYEFMVGHNRKATQGSISSRNAHPFTHEHITLVHNGTLTSRNGVSGSKIIEVDSEAICHAFATNGAKDTLPKLDGAYALVWYDAKEKSLNLARNSERPLHFAFSEDGKNLFFASEAWMIRSIMPNVFSVKSIFKLNEGMHVKFYSNMEDLREYTTEEFSVLPDTSYGYWMGGEWHTYQTSNKGKSEEEKRIKRQSARLAEFGYWRGESVLFTVDSFQKYSGTSTKGTIKGTTNTHKGMVVDDVVGYYVDQALYDSIKTSGNNLVGKAIDCSFNKNTHKLTITLEDIKELVKLPEPEDVGLEERESEEWVQGPDRTLITLKEFEELTKHGCAFCTGDVHVEDDEDIEWTDNKQPICYDCQERKTG